MRSEYHLVIDEGTDRGWVFTSGRVWVCFLWCSRVVVSRRSRWVLSFGEWLLWEWQVKMLKSQGWLGWRWWFGTLHPLTPPSTLLCCWQQRQEAQMHSRKTPFCLSCSIWLGLSIRCLACDLQGRVWWELGACCLCPFYWSRSYGDTDLLRKVSRAGPVPRILSTHSKDSGHPWDRSPQGSVTLQLAGLSDGGTPWWWCPYLGWASMVQKPFWW